MSKLSKAIIVILIIALGIMTYLYITERAKNNNPETNVVGTYYNTDWNGRSATLVINEDGTCKYPTGSSGTWQLKDNYIEMNLGTVDYTGVYKGGTIQDDIHKATIMNNGVMLHDHFFEKMN